MAPIGEDGLSKVISGETSLEELQRVIFYEEESGRLCPSCRGAVSSEFLYCPHCGTAVASTCPRCEHRLDGTWLVCPFCGTRRETSEAPVPGAPGEEAEVEAASWSPEPPAPRARRRRDPTPRTRF
jgi:predicted RNA-binding Zn-ribbon protein involved in translation (DUF1610 family)